MTQDVTTMKAALLTGHGDSGVIDIRNDIERPSIGGQDVLIKVLAAGVNNTDINLRKAWYSKGDRDSSDASWNGDVVKFPRIQGIDVCGTIIETGAGVNPTLLGKRVLVDPCIRFHAGEALSSPIYLGSDCDGGFAQFLRIDHRQAHPINCSLAATELASFPCAYSTAENLLHSARVKSGERVLISGASGGVGSAAVQLALIRGAEVLAIANTKKHDALKELGRIHLLDSNRPLLSQLSPNSIDVVIDVVAGSFFEGYLELLRPHGRYATAGAVGGAMVNLDIRTLYLKNLTFHGKTELDHSIFPRLVRLIEGGKIKPLVAKIFSLDNIVHAQDYFEAKEFIGKIVLEVN